jgi:hypothetical protein
LWLANAPAVAFALIGFGGSAAAISFGNGCQWLVASPTFVSVVAEPLGSARVALPIPRTPALRGLLVHARALTVDAAGALSGVAAPTGALRITLDQPTMPREGRVRGRLVSPTGTRSRPPRAR